MEKIVAKELIETKDIVEVLDGVKLGLEQSIKTAVETLELLNRITENLKGK